MLGLSVRLRVVGVAFAEYAKTMLDEQAWRHRRSRQCRNHRASKELETEDGWQTGIQAQRGGGAGI
eukprot:884605-Rhodomonas_salina.2